MARPSLRLALVLPLALVSCATTSDLPEGRPLTPEEVAYEKALQSYSEVATDDRSRARLIRELDRTLSNWHAAQAEYLGSKERQLTRNYEEILQRKTYMNFETLLDLLRNGDDYQRAIAAAALGFSRLAEPADEREKQAFRERWPPKYPDAIGPLVEATESDDFYIANNAVLALAQLGDPNTPIEPIAALLDRDEPEIRSNAALALARILTPETGERAIAALLLATNDPEPKVRLHAITAIRRCRHPAGVGSVAKLLSDRYELVAMNAARTLAEIGDKSACAYLITRLKEVLGSTPDGKFRPVSDLDRRRRNLTDYLIGALEELSGEDYGDDIEEWQEWWNDVRDEI